VDFRHRLDAFKHISKVRNELQSKVSQNSIQLITGSSSDNGLASPHLPIGPHKKIIPASITQPMAGFEAPTWLR